MSYQLSPDTPAAPPLSELDVLDGMRLFRVARPATGTARGALLFCHGFAEHSGRYLAMAEGLAAQGYHCFLFDFRGHGRSEGRRGHVFAFDEYIRDFNAARQWARAEIGDLPLFVLAHSNGALVALHAVARDPSGLAGVVFSSPFWGFALKVPKLKVLAARQLSRFLPALGIPTGLDATFVSHDPEVVRLYASDPLVTHVASGRWFTETEAAHARAPDAARLLQLPVLVQVGGDDRIASSPIARTVFEELGSADRTFQEYGGFYHEIWFELDRVRPISAVAAWLEAHLPAASPDQDPQ